MSTTTAKIAARGCSSTGITDDMVERLRNPGQDHDVDEILNTAADELTQARDSLTNPPAPNQATEDHLRNLQRSFYYERKLVEDGPQLPQDGASPEPSVSDVLNAGEQYIPHAFQDGAEDPDICNLCGGREVATVHHNDDAPDNEADTEEPDEDAKVLEFSGKP